MSNETKNDPSNAISRLPKKKADSEPIPSQLTEAKVHMMGSPLMPDPEMYEEESAPQIQPEADSVPKVKFNFWPPLWTIASVLSLCVNVVLIVVLLALWTNLSALNMGGVTNVGTSLLGGLYSNFEKMDRAHITRTIPVEAQIPVKFDLPINQQTTVVLSQDVTINNALVTVQTGGLNITRALTTIVLPQGTNLPIILNLTVPVDTSVPVKLNVNVDIPLTETQLHDPFVGLRNVVQPFYCMLNPKALNLDGQPVCK